MGLCALAVAMWVGESTGQEARTPGTAIVNFPEGGELRVFVDYVGRTLGVRFVYGDELKGQTIELRPSPVEIPKDRLLSMLAGLLRVHDLAMVEVSPNVYRIVRAEQSSRSVAALLPQGQPPDPASLRMVTQVLRVPSAKVETLAKSLGKFTSSAKSELILAKVLDFAHTWIFQQRDEA